MRTPTLAEVIRAAIEADRAELHVAMPGRVESYNADRETVDVRLQFRHASVAEDGTVALEDYPVIPDVPIVWPSGGGGAHFLTFPLAKGDGVEVIFQDFDPSAWRESGAVGSPGDLRRHALGNAVAIPGLRPTKELLGSSKVSASKVVIGSIVALGAAAAAEAIIKGTSYRAQEDTLIAGLHAAFTTLQGAAVGPLAPLQPGFAAAAAALLAFQNAAAAGGSFLSVKHKVDQ